MNLGFDVNELFINDRKRKGKVIEVLEMFLNSNKPLAEVLFLNSEYKSSNSCYSTFSTAIRRDHYPIKCFVSGGKVYLKKLGPDEVNKENGHVE